LQKFFHGLRHRQWEPPFYAPKPAIDASSSPPDESFTIGSAPVTPPSPGEVFLTFSDRRFKLSLFVNSHSPFGSLIFVLSVFFQENYNVFFSFFFVIFEQFFFLDLLLFCPADAQLD